MDFELEIKKMTLEQLQDILARFNAAKPKMNAVALNEFTPKMALVEQEIEVKKNK